MVPDPIIFKPISGQVYHFYSAPYLAPPIILEPFTVYVYHFYIIHALAPLSMLEHFFGHCGTLSGLKGPSWTFMDPKMDPARLISEDPW